MKKTRTILLVIFLAVGGICLLTWKEKSTSNISQKVALKSVATRISTGRDPTNVNPTSEAKRIEKKLDKVVPPAGNSVDAAISTGTPQEALHVFNIIERCVQLTRVQRTITSQPSGIDGDRLRKQFAQENSDALKDCESLSERQRADRTKLAEKAARVGLPGAAFAYFAAGPNGQPDDLVSRPNDPAVLAWKDQAIHFLQAAAESGDANAIAQLAQVYSGQGLEEKDFAKMLGYSLALEEIQSSRNKKAASQLGKLNTYFKSQANGADLENANVIRDSIINKCCQTK